MSIGTLGIPNVPGTVAAIPINPMGCDGITWDVPQSPMINELLMYLTTYRLHFTLSHLRSLCMSYYSGLKITLSVHHETRSYLQLLHIIGKLRYRRFTVPFVRSLGYCVERTQGDFLHAVSYGCKYIDLPTVSLLLLSELLHNNNKYLSISFTVHLGGRQCAEELLSAL